MRQNQEWILLSFRIAGGKGRNAFERDTFFAFPMYRLHGSHFDRRQLRVSLMRNFAQVVPLGHGHVHRMIWIAHAHRDLPGPVRIFVAHGAFDNPLLPAINRFEYAAMKLLQIGLHPMRHSHPRVTLRITRQRHRRSLQV
jgi:hypothetical protein